MKLSVAFSSLLTLNLIAFGDAYFGQSHLTLEDLSLIQLTEEEDEAKGRLFFGGGNSSDLAAFAALSLFPLLFLAAAMGGAMLQWWMMGQNDCDDHYYYDSGYGGGGGYGSGHGGYKRSDDEGYDYDYKRSYQKRSTKSDIELTGMCYSFLQRKFFK